MLACFMKPRVQFFDCRQFIEFMYHETSIVWTVCDLGFCGQQNVIILLREKLFRRKLFYGKFGFEKAPSEQFCGNAIALCIHGSIVE